MIAQQTHEMNLLSTHPSGEEEWLCPECGRRYMMQWSPSINQIILEVGDESAIHNGSTGGLYISPTGVNAADNFELSEDLRAALEDALKDIDFDDPPTATDS